MSFRRDPLGPDDREAVRTDPQRRPLVGPAGPALPDGADELFRQRVHRFPGGSRAPGWRLPSDPAKEAAEVPDPALVEVAAALRSEIEGLMARYPDSDSAAIPALAAAQRVHGWCSPEAIEQVACVMRLTPAYLTAVVGFYDMLEATPVGRKTVYVCTNISCSLRGGDTLLQRLREHLAEDPEANVRGFECLGACDIAPMCSVNGIYVGPVEGEDEIATLAEQIRADADPLPDKQLVRRRVADRTANREEITAAAVDAGTLSPVVAQDDPDRAGRRGGGATA